MRVYGADRYDTLSCKYRCCGGQLRSRRSNGARKVTLAYQRRARTRARTEAKRACEES